MAEDLEHLEKWIDEILSTIQTLLKEKQDKDILVFMIGNTSQDTGGGRPYVTPIRKIYNGYVFGSVIYSQTQATILSSKIDGLVDYIFVDAEKKIPPKQNPDHSPFDFFGMENKNLNPEGLIEYGNISSICAQVIKESHMFAYKGNDITVDTTWLFLIEKFRELSGKKILVYGSGNIGNKLSLKLIECGCNVILVSRDPSRSTRLIDSLNKIKSQNALSSITTSDEPNESSIGVDAIIGCTNKEPVITESMISNMSDNGVVIDIGKGTVHQEAIEECNKRGIDIWRLDITAIINSLIQSSRSMKNLLSNSFGRRQLSNGAFVVSGGFMGSKYDVIVDSYLHPRSIVGVCEGNGKIFFDLDSKAQKEMNLVEAHIKSEQGS